MRTSRIVIAVIIGLIGLVWIGQGSGLIAGSAMSGSLFWLVVGVVLVVLAAGIVIRETRLAPRG
jgi:glucose dehydrogenase